MVLSKENLEPPVADEEELPLEFKLLPALFRAKLKLSDPEDAGAKKG